LRQTLSDSMARDNTMLEERSRILEAMSELINTMSRAAHEQRVAIDELVTTSTDLLGRTGQQLTQTLDAHSDQMQQAHAQLTSSAAEVASLGEAFGVGVQLFGQSNEKLLGQLQRIEEALGQSMTRSNEQLDYYVAQAREVIDLSIGSQKHILDELRQLAHPRAMADSPA
jgi:methyl-accepting chemotaxis protein